MGNLRLNSLRILLLKRECFIIQTNQNAQIAAGVVTGIIMDTALILDSLYLQVQKIGQYQ